MGKDGFECCRGSFKDKDTGPVLPVAGVARRCRATRGELIFGISLVSKDDFIFFKPEEKFPFAKNGRLTEKIQPTIKW